jgi:HTH-type transcriptional regulator / antitoxin HigA
LDAKEPTLAWYRHTVSADWASPSDVKATLREIESLMRAAPNSPEGDRLDVLVTLVEAYERQQVKDLEPMIGHSNRV